MKIKQTRNYSEFVMDVTNRPITARDGAKLNALRNSMTKYGFLPFPIIVRRQGQKLVILDGQHRFAIAEELKLPLLFVETDRDDIVIADTASAQSPWTVFHYAASFAAQGNEDYAKLLEFAEKSGLPISRACSLLGGEQAGSGNIASAVKAGTFRVKDMKYAQRVVAIVEVLAKYEGWAKSTLSLGAISRFCRVADFDDEQLIRKIEAFPHLLKNCATLELFSEMYENVYNHAARTKIPLAFMARELAGQRTAAKCKKP